MIKYGQEPCVSLKNAMEKDSKKTYVCQYFDICPRTLNERKIKSSDIVITTLEGFCYCTFGVQRENFLQYAIANFDLVIMDEFQRFQDLLNTDSKAMDMSSEQSMLNHEFLYSNNTKVLLLSITILHMRLSIVLLKNISHYLWNQIR